MILTLSSNIAAFNSAFDTYLAFTRKLPQEAIERKVMNIGIRLFKGFRAHQFGGVPRDKMVAETELKARTAAGRGTVVREALLERYEAARSSLVAEAKALRDRAHSLAGSAKGDSVLMDRNRKARVALWQATVGNEVDARQHGIGVLAAAFLWFRWRGKGERARLVDNRKGKTIGSVEVGDGFAVISAELAGIAEVGNRYGIIAEAIDAETADTLDWIKQQLEDGKQPAFGFMSV